MKGAWKTPRSGSPTYLIEGLGPVLEYARAAPSLIRAINCRDAETRQELQRLAAFITPPPIFTLTSSAPGLLSKSKAACCAEVFGHTLTLQDFTPFGPEVTRAVVLDHVTDPRNVGAIARTAAFFGFHAIFAPSRRQGLLTEASVATAQGAFAHLPLVVVPNISQLLVMLKKEEFWIIGADVGASPIAQQSSDFNRVAIVLGSENEGLSRVTKAKCDVLAGIPGSPAGLQSLNVSVAAGIF